MKKFFLTFVCVVAVFMLRPVIAEEKAANDWILQYAGQSTNKLRWDKRLEPLIRRTIPKKNVKDLLAALGGPPDLVYVVKNRFVSMSACVAHACPMKGFFWIDIESKKGLGAIWGDEYDDPDRLTITSNDISSNQIPPEAKSALIAWLFENDLHPNIVILLDGNGKRVLLEVASFQPPMKFSPSEAGPSFDCSKAATLIEKSICNSETLAKADLSLAKLFSQIKQGHAEQAGRKELLDFQRAWIKERNVKCGADKNIVPCLENSYQAQYDKLRHWLPTGK